MTNREKAELAVLSLMKLVVQECASHAPSPAIWYKGKFRLRTFGSSEPSNRGLLHPWNCPVEAGRQGSTTESSLSAFPASTKERLSESRSISTADIDRGTWLSSEWAASRLVNWKCGCLRKLAGYKKNTGESHLWKDLLNAKTTKIIGTCAQIKEELLILLYLDSKEFKFPAINMSSRSLYDTLC